MHPHVAFTIATLAILQSNTAFSTTPKEDCKIKLNGCISDADIKNARSTYPLANQIEGYVYYDFDQIMPGHIVEESPSLVTARYSADSLCPSKYEFAFEKHIQSIAYERSLKNVRYFFIRHDKNGIAPLSITNEVPSKIMPGNPSGQTHPEHSTVRCDLIAN